MRFGYFKLGGYIAYKYFLSEIFTYVSECLPEQNVASAVSRQSFCVANQIFKKLCDYNGNGAFHDNIFKFPAFFIFVHNISEHKENLVIAFVIQYGKVRRFFISYFVIKTVLDKLGKKRKRVAFKPLLYVCKLVHIYGREKIETALMTFIQFSVNNMPRAFVYNKFNCQYVMHVHGAASPCQRRCIMLYHIFFIQRFQTFTRRIIENIGFFSHGTHSFSYKNIIIQSIGKIKTGRCKKYTASVIELFTLLLISIFREEICFRSKKVKILLIPSTPRAAVNWHTDEF